MKKDPCYGCPTIECDYKYYGKDCPCVKCLVKVSCDETCEDLSLFIKKCQKQRTTELQETWV